MMKSLATALYNNTQPSFRSSWGVLTRHDHWRCVPPFCGDQKRRAFALRSDGPCYKIYFAVQPRMRNAKYRILGQNSGGGSGPD